MPRKFRLYYKIVIALVVFAAVSTQFVHGMQFSTFNPANFFSFFTIESNIFGAVILLLSAVVPGKKLAYWRGAATLHMAITGVIYAILLSGADVQTPIPWVNAVLHYAFPVALLLDWLIDRPPRRISWKSSLVWLAYPLIYTIYSLVRGHFTAWYPYPFLNVTQHGYMQVLITSLAITGPVVLLAFLVAKLPGLTLQSRAKNG
jgi:hypothetical protein